MRKPGQGTFKEKGSKFLSFAFPVETEDQVKGHLEKLKKEFFDARHHCFAWILGADKNRYRCFDDGEPNHSAGDPILGQIRSKNLTNVLVVVVRYFGGTKLGVGGLIAAYKTAAESALADAGSVEKNIEEYLGLEFPYEDTPEIMKLVKTFDLEILQQEFEHQCKMKIRYSIRIHDQLMDRIHLLQATGRMILYELL